MKKVLFAAFISIVLAILPIYEVFADDHDLTITRSDSSSAVEGDDYSWDTDDTNKLIIKTNNLIVSGTTESEYIELSQDVTSLTINSLNIDLSSSSQTAIESLEEDDIVTITVSGTNNISTGEVDETEINGLKAPKLKLLGDGKLYIRGGHTYNKHRAIHTNSYFETSVSFLYLNAYNGIWVDEEEGVGSSIKINSGDVYLLTDNYGIISTYYESNMIIDDANVTIYSGLGGVLVGNLTLNNDSQLFVQIENCYGANANDTIYTKHKLKLSNDAAMYLTHCGGYYTNISCVEGIELPADRKLKACFRALGRIEECVDIEEDISTGFVMNSQNDNAQYTVVYGNPTRLQAKPIDFKTKVLSGDSLEISGLEVPDISLGNLPEGRWYYVTNLEYYEGQISCLQEPYCFAEDYEGACKYHRMAYIAEGHATVMPILQELTVDSGKAIISDFDFDSPYIGIVYAGTDSIICPNTSNIAHLSYGVGLAEIEDITVGAEKDNANILKPDSTGKIRDRLPSLWCGEWELDNIFIGQDNYTDYIFTENTYYIGVDYNGTKRTKGDLILNINNDGSYSFSGLINGSGYIQFIDREDDPGMSITIDEKIFIINCNTETPVDDDGNEYEEYDRLQLNYYCNTDDDDIDISDYITYTFVHSNAPRLNVSYDEENISLLVGGRLHTTDLPDVSKTGYVFGGWFSDADCFKPFYDIDYLFVDTTIYPKWFNEITDSYLTHTSGTFTVNGSAPIGGYAYLYYGNSCISESDADEDGNFNLIFDHAIAPGEYQMSFSSGDYPDDFYGTCCLVDVESDNVGTLNFTLKVGDSYIANYGFYPIAVDGINDYSLLGDDGSSYEIDTFELLDTEDTNVMTISDEMGDEVDNKEYFGLDSYCYPSEGNPMQLVNTGSIVLTYKISYPTYKFNNLTLYRTIPDSGTAAELTKLDSKPTSNYQDGTYYVGDNCIYFYSNKFAIYGISSNNKVEYTMEEKPSEPINTDNNQDVVFKSVAPYSKFFDGDNIIGSVKVDGNKIDSTNYYHAKGSTKITLKSSYLSTLSVGEHTMEIVSTDGSAMSSFTITRSNTPTPTPDPGHNHSDNRHIVLNTGIN